MRCVEGAPGLGGHVDIGVGRVVVHRHHADAIPGVESFLLDVAVHFCSQLSHIFHSENGSFEVLSLQSTQSGHSCFLFCA